MDDAMHRLLRRIVNGRTDLVFDLVESGAPASTADEDGVPLIRWCAYFGDVSAIRFLLTRGERLESLGDNLELNGACYQGHWRLCEILVERGASVKWPLPDTGEVPLHAALCKPNRPTYDHVVRVLLANGAKPNVATLPGVETGGFMRDVRTRGETPLHRAAAFGTPDAIRLLLEAGADKTARDVNGDSPLTWASWHLRPNYVLAMLCHGPHRIRQAAVDQSVKEHGLRWGGMEAHLLGEPSD